MADMTSRNWISAYLDGELSPSEVADAERTLETEFDCRDELQSYRELGDLLRSLPEPPLPAAFAQTVLKRCEREALLPTPVELHDTNVTAAKSSPAKSWGIWTASLLTTAAVLFLAARLIISPSENSPEQTLAHKTPNALADSDHVVPESAGAVIASNSQPADARFEQKKIRVGRSNFAKMATRKENSTQTVPVPSPGGGAPADGKPEAFRGGLGGIRPADDPGKLAQMLKDGLKIDPSVQIGDVIPYLEVSGNRTAVIELMVVDVNKSVGQFEVLLSKKKVSPAFPSDQKNAKKSATLPLKLHKAQAGADHQLIAVYVESTQMQLAEVMRELQRKTGTVHIGLKPPRSFNEIELTEINDAPQTRIARGKRDTAPLTLASAVSAARKMAATQKRRVFPETTAPGAEGARKPTAAKSDDKHPLPKPDSNKAKAAGANYVRHPAVQTEPSPSFRMRVTVAEKSSPVARIAAAGATPRNNGPLDRVKGGKQTEKEPANRAPAAPIRVIFLFRRQVAPVIAPRPSP